MVGLLPWPSKKRTVPSAAALPEQWPTGARRFRAAALKSSLGAFGMDMSRM